MSDTALGLSVVVGLLVLVAVVALLDLRRGGLRRQVDDAAVRRGLAQQEARNGKTTPTVTRDGGVF